MNFDYEKTLKLKHHEQAAKVNLRTGEVTLFDEAKRVKTTTHQVFEPSAIFHKGYNNSWLFLHRELTPLQFKAAHVLVTKAKAFTNSLEPLNDSTTLVELTSVLDVSINKVRPILNKLWDLGVYGKFSISEISKPYTNYWVLNPYLSFNGKMIESDISRLFQDTHIARAFNDPYYQKRN